MSTRSRAVPWFLERPPYYVNERKLAPGAFGEVTVWRDWSWDGTTWFRSNGSCPRPQLFGPFKAPPHVAERYPLIGVWSAMDQEKYNDAADRFLGEVISRGGVRA